MKVSTKAVAALALLLSVAPVFADAPAGTTPAAAKPKAAASATVAQAKKDRDAAKAAFDAAVRDHGKGSPEAKAAHAKLEQARKAYRTAAGLPKKTAAH